MPLHPAVVDVLQNAKKAHSKSIEELNGPKNSHLDRTARKQMITRHETHIADIEQAIKEGFIRGNGSYDALIQKLQRLRDEKSNPNLIELLEEAKGEIGKAVPHS